MNKDATKREQKDAQRQARILLNFKKGTFDSIKYYTQVSLGHCVYNNYLHHTNSCSVLHGLLTTHSPQKPWNPGPRYLVDRRGSNSGRGQGGGRGPS